MRIVVCGLNGAGKSTLAEALAKQLNNYYYLDVEDLYFQKTDSSYKYIDSNTHEMVEHLLLNEIKNHRNFIFSCVKAEYGEEIYPYFSLCILVHAPEKIRLERLINRSFQAYGDRMLPGGDLYEREKGFIKSVMTKDKETSERWVKHLHCPLIRVDGTIPIEDNIYYIVNMMRILT